MKRSMIMIAALMLVLGVIVSSGAARTSPPVAQDDAAKKEHDAAYKAWYDANAAKDYPKAVTLAKAYLEKFPTGAYADYLKKWVTSLPILRIQFSTAVQEKNKPDTIRLVREILANKDLSEKDRLDYLWFVNTDLVANEIFANPTNYSHAAEVTEFSQMILPLVEAGKQPSNVKEWKQNSAVAYLYQTLATIEDHNKNTDKALEYHMKALNADPANAASAFACGKIHYDRYGVATKAYQAFPDADQAAAADKKPDAKPEVVAALEKVNKEADQVIECWAKYLALTAGTPNQARSQVEQAVTSLYKYRHNDSTEGLQQLIDKYKSGGATTSTPPQPTNTGAAKPPAN